MTSINIDTKRCDETPEEKISRLEHILKQTEDEMRFYMKRSNDLEHLLHNIMQLLSNPYLKIDSIDS